MILVEAYVEELNKLKKYRDEFYAKLINSRPEVAKQWETDIYYGIEDPVERSRQIEEAINFMQAEIETKTDIYSLKIAELEKVIEELKTAKA